MLMLMLQKLLILHFPVLSICLIISFLQPQPQQQPQQQQQQQQQQPTASTDTD